MIPLKESLAVLEKYARRQRTIGVTETGVYVNDRELGEIRTAVAALKTFYGGRNWSCKTKAMTQAAVNYIHIPFEVDGQSAKGTIVNVNVVVRARKAPHIRPTQYATITMIPFYKQTEDVPVLVNNEYYFQ